MKYIKNSESGFIVASMIISMTFLFLIAAITFRLATSSYRTADSQLDRVNAQLAADAGADSAISNLNLDEDYAGTGGEVPLFTDNNLNFRTTYESSVLDGTSDSHKIIAVTGRVYSPISSTDPFVERSYEIDMRGLGVGGGGTFAIVTGVGGLVLENSSKIVDGDVYVNGTVTMSNQSQIGTTTNQVNVKAAYNSCPTGGGSSYPSPCTSGNPITINDPATLYGQVCANNQTDPSGIDTSGTNGLYQVGVDPECGSDPTIAILPLPDHDRTQQISDINVASGSSYYRNCNSNNESRVWPHGLHITGDVFIGKNCKVTVLGDVWIDGDLRVANSAQLIVSDTLNSGIVDGQYPSIMVDGSGGVEFYNKAKIVDNSSDIGAQVVTYWSSASCSPSCGDVTGTDLFNSTPVTTIYLEQSADAASSILYAKWSQVELNNGGDIGALVGQRVRMRNSAAVTFGASVSGGAGGSSSNPVWLVDNYRRVF